MANVVVQTVVVVPGTAPLAIDEAVKRYALSNEAGGKSPKTIAWYTAMLGQFVTYLKTTPYPSYLPAINIERARDYILFLHHRPRYEGHPYSPVEGGAALAQDGPVPCSGLEGLLLMAALRGLHHLEPSPASSASQSAGHYGRAADPR